MKKKTGIRILSFLMTAILVSMCFVTAMATEGGSGGVSDTVAFKVPTDLNTHSFKAYQIFSCKMVDGNMTDVAWGNGINSVKFLEKLAALQPTVYNDTMTAADCAAAIATRSVADEEAVKKNIQIAAEYALIAANGVALNSTGTTTLNRGYYLIEDVTSPVAEGDALNHTALTYTSTDGASFQIKTDKPTVEKKVKEDDRYTTDDGYGAGFNDVADANIGQSVDFLLVGAVPDMTYYDTYTIYTFEDTLSKGLTVSSDIEVWLSGDMTKSSGDTNITSHFDPNVTVNADGTTTITVALKPGQDLKTISGMTSDKFILVTYQAKLNADAVIGLPGNPNEVILKYSNNPNGTGEGQTVKDKVIVFTYEVDVKKVDSTATTTILEGAKFRLYRENNGSNSYAVLTKVDDTTYRVGTWTGTEANATEIVTVADELIKIVGLDDGTYYLDEFEAPSGYLAATNPITIKVTAGIVHTQTWDGTDETDVLKDVTNGVDADDGNIEKTVQNSPIGILPETGGMGTTLFTLGGLVLMMAAAMLFVLRRREEV